MDEPPRDHAKRVANLGNFLGGFQTWREGPNHANVDRIRKDMSRFSINQGSERVVSGDDIRRPSLITNRFSIL